MVAARPGESLRHVLEPEQYSSHDSAPPRLSRPLPATSAPQVLAVATVVSFLLLLWLHGVPAMRAAFPEGDFYLSRYEGQYVVPLRAFILSFQVAFATAIPARPLMRVKFLFELILPFIMLCVTMDLCNGLMTRFLGVAMPLQVMSIATGIVGFFFFSMTVLARADMPAQDDGPADIHFKRRSLVVLGTVMVVSALLSLYIERLELPFIAWLRDLSLLGGVSVGFFLFIPLLFFLLNFVAAVGAVFRPRRTFAEDITIILPAFNEAHDIGAAISAADAACGRYGGAVTLVVIDNDSTDDTRGAATRAFSECRHMQTRIITEPRRGKANALNAGLALVETPVFARLDADTMLEPDALARALSYFSDERVGGVGGVPLPPGGGTFDTPRLVEVLLRTGYDQVAFGAADVIVGIPGMFACYRTEAVRAVGGFAVGINGEDSDVALRIGESGYRLIVDPEVHYLSEVPRTFAHLREQRLRWYRSLYHVVARNARIMTLRFKSARGQFVLPYLLINSGRRAMGWPLLIFALNFMLLNPDPRSTAHVTSVLAVLLGAPLINAIIAIIVNLRWYALLYLPSHIVFRMVRQYLTLESLLSMTYERFQTNAPRRRIGHTAAEEAAWANPLPARGNIRAKA